MDRDLMVAEALDINAKYMSSGMSLKKFAVVANISNYKMNLCRSIVNNQNKRKRPVSNKITLTQVSAVESPSPELGCSGVIIDLGEIKINLQNKFNESVFIRVTEILSNYCRNV